MNLYEAIFKRRSIRKYKEEKVPDQLLQKLLAFSKKVAGLDEGISVKIEVEDNTKGQIALKGIGKIEAPYYLVLFSEDKKGCERNAGYIMEQVVLYLTAHGLGCCYMGSSHAAVPEPEGMKQMVTVAFGYAQGLLYRDPAVAKRLSLRDLCVFKEEVDETTKNILKAARLAPSSMNTQPWRFIVYQGKMYLFACRQFPSPALLSTQREFNMGIMMSHLMLAAEEMWLNMKIETEDQFQKKAYKNGEYVGTVILGA